jgi:GNAT superfamily N-acetyltransferase
VQWPADTDELIWRVTSLDDLEGIFALFAAISSVEHPNWTETREEILDELTHSWVHLARDSIVAVERATGDIVATGLDIVPPGQETLVRVILFGGVHPSWRGTGIGAVLAGWQQARAIEQLAASDKTLPGWIVVQTESRAPDHARLFERLGFTRSRWFLGQQRMISDDIPLIEIPGEIRLVPFEERYTSAALEAKNGSFRDHWGSQPTSEEQWTSILALPTFAAEHSFLAVTATDEVVGILMTELPRDDWERQGYSSGYIPVVGVVREWRRKGIAPALLARVLESLREAGIERAELDVDSDSPTGAVRLYAGMGFVEKSRMITLTKVF